LALLDIQEAIITIDPMVTQTDIVRLLREKKADYVLTLLRESSNSLHPSKKLVYPGSKQPF